MSIDRTHIVEQVREHLARHPVLTRGLGDRERHCSIAAVNLALSGKLTDAIPDCMSEVVGRWIIRIQDAMPDDLRNSAAWRELLPLAAGTGREHEPERLAMILDWLWGVVLPQHQPIADAGGYGPEWRQMTERRTEAAARAAAAWAVARAAEAAARAASAASRAAARAAEAAARATSAASRAAEAAADKAGAAAQAAWAASATEAAAWAAGAEGAAEFWSAVDPVALLRRLVESR